MEPQDEARGRPPVTAGSLDSNVGFRAQLSTTPPPCREFGNTPLDDAAEDEESGAAVTDRPRPYRLPRGRAALATFLLLTGVLLIGVGAAQSALPAVGVGALALIPGAYMSYGFCQAVRGNPRYRGDPAWQAVEETD